MKFRDINAIADRLRKLFGTPASEEPVSIMSRALITPRGDVALKSTNEGLDANNSPLFGFKARPIDDATTARTLTQSDSGNVIHFSSGSAIAVTLPADMERGSSGVLLQVGAGAITASAGSGASILIGDTATTAQGDALGWYVVSNDDDNSAAYKLTLS